MVTTPAEIEEEDAGTSTPDDSNQDAASASTLDPKHEAQLAFLAGEEGSAPDGEEADEAAPEAVAAPAGKDPDAIQAHLAGDGDKPSAPAATADEKKTKDSSTAADVVAADEAAKAAGKPGEKPAAKTETTPIGDEPAGLDEVEKAIKGKAQKAFVELRKQGKQLREQLRTQSEEVAKEREWADHGRGFVGIFKERGGVDDLAAINDDQHVGVVRIQAALNRVAQAQAAGQAPSEADAKTVQDAYERLAPMVKSKPAAAATLEPFTGELPAAQRELVDAGLVDEADVRLLLAAKAMLAKPKEVPAKAAPPAVVAPAAKAAVPAQQPQRRESSAPAPDAERMDAARQMRDYLVGKGVQESAIEDHFLSAIQPALIRTLADTAKKTGESSMGLFYRLSPQAQLRLVQIAQEGLAEVAQPARDHVVGQVPPKVPRRQAPLFQRELGSGTRSRLSTGSADHATKAANTQAFLAGEA